SFVMSSEMSIDVRSIVNARDHAAFVHDHVGFDAHIANIVQTAHIVEFVRASLISAAHRNKRPHRKAQQRAFVGVIPV
ncbi:MAG: hypothetical protein AAFR76_14660, partial [Planctomycetota bacterium]